MQRRSSVVVYDIDEDEEKKRLENSRANRRTINDYNVFAQSLPKVHVTQYDTEDEFESNNLEKYDDNNEEDIGETDVMDKLETESYELQELQNEKDDDNYDYKLRKGTSDDVGNEIADDEMNYIDDDHDDDDFFMDELMETKIIPRTLPNTEIFICVNDAYASKKFHDMNSNELAHYRSRNQSHISTFIKKSPFNQMSSKTSIISTNSNLNNPDKSFYSLNIPRRQPLKVKRENSMETDNESHLNPVPRSKSNRHSYDQTFQKSHLHGSFDDNMRRFVTSPLFNTQDKLLSDMNKLTAVKTQVKDINMYDPFPAGFEDKFKKLKQNHRKMRQLLKERESRKEEQRKKMTKTNNELLSVHSQLSDVNKKKERSPSTSVKDETHTGRTTPSPTTISSVYKKMDQLREAQIDSVMNDTEDSQVIQQLVNVIREL